MREKKLKICLICLYIDNKMTGACKRWIQLIKHFATLDNCSIVILTTAKGVRILSESFHGITKTAQNSSISFEQIKYRNAESLIKRWHVSLILLFSLRKFQDYLVICDYWPSPLIFQNNIHHWQLIHDTRKYKYARKFKWSKLSALTFFNYLLIKLLKRVITVSRSSAFELKGLNTNVKLLVSYNGINLESKSVFSERIIRKNKYLDKNIARVIYIATSEIRKNHDYFRSIVSASKGLNFHFTLVLNDLHSGQELQKYNEFIANNTIKNLDILSKISENTLRQKLTESHIYITPSWYEGFGMPIIEALVNGCQIICNDIPIHHEVGGQWATYDKCDNPEYTLSLIKALANKRRSENEIDEIYKYLNQFYSWNIIAQKLLQDMSQELYSA